MHIAVLLAGVADPRKPLPAPPSGDSRDLRADPSVSYKLSPFDEAALEIALKLRDGHADTRVTALVTDGARDTALMRAVIALRPDRVLGLPTPADQQGNGAWLARHVPETLWPDGATPDLILIGREYGDLDDGMLPPYLAEAWALPYAGLALRVQADDGGWILTRAMASRDESLRLPAPAMASITNDKGNRLRHPLMKNVLLARQQRLEQAQAEPSAPAPRAVLAQAAPVRAPERGASACRMLDGPVDAQARALAAYLRTPHAER